MKFLLLITMLIFSVSSFADDKCLVNKGNLELEPGVAVSGDQVDYCAIKTMDGAPNKPSDCVCADTAATGETDTPSDGSQCAADPEVEGETPTTQTPDSNGANAKDDE